MNTNNSNPGLFRSIVTNKCPHCRKGNLFIDPNPYHLKSTMQMPDKCPVCDQKYELQTGFYFGTGFVSYALSVMLSGFSFVMWMLTIGMSFRDNRVWWWLGANAAMLILLQPLIQRLARSIWISIFVRYERS